MTKKTDFDFAKISKEQSNELTTIVKETVATDFGSPKSFTIVDLWNIRRQGKTTLNRKAVVFL